MEYVVLSNPTVNSNMLSLPTLKCSVVYGSSESASLIMSYQVIMTVRWEIAAHPQSPYIQYTHWIQVFNIVFGWTRSGDPAQISKKKRKTQIRTKHMVKTATHFFGNFRQTPPLQGYWTYLNARMPICEWCYSDTSLLRSRRHWRSSEQKIALQLKN